MTEIFKPDIKITELLNSAQFTVSAEVIPPRNGSPQSEILEQISLLIQSGAQFLSVTKGAGGSLRGGSLPIAQVIKDHFKVPCIAHFTSRDITPEEVENQLIDHHYFGIRNILALRGDPPVGVPDWTPKERSYPYAYQLIEQIQRMNQGSLLSRPGYEAKSQTQFDFCIGAAAYPDDPTHEQRIGYFKRKIEAGAEYGITQMIYDTQSYEKFLNDLAKENCHAPILPGLRILKSQAQATRMKERFNIPIPESLFNSLPKDENPQQALEVFLKLVDQFKAAGAPGLHVFVLTDTKSSCAAIKDLRAKY